MIRPHHSDDSAHIINLTSKGHTQPELQRELRTPCFWNALRGKRKGNDKMAVTASENSFFKFVLGKLIATCLKQTKTYNFHIHLCLYKNKKFHYPSLFVEIVCLYILCWVRVKIIKKTDLNYL